MKTKVQIALGAASVLLVLTLGYLAESISDPSAPAPAETVRAQPPTGEPAAPAISAAEEEERESIGSRSESRTSAAAAEPAMPGSKATAGSAETVRGRVIDAGGRPVAKASILLGPFDSDPMREIRPQSDFPFGPSRLASGGVPEGTERARPIAESDGEGRFVVPLLPDGSVLHARSEHHVPVTAFDFYGTDQTDIEPILIVAVPAAVAGSVVDEEGRPIRAVQIGVRVPEHLKPSLGLSLDRAEPLEYFAISGEDGRFEIADAPSIEGRHIVAEHHGSPPQAQPISARADTQLRIVLQLAQQFETAARGIVLDAEGKPVADANLRLGDRGAKSGPDGRFVLDATTAQEGDEILAAKPGFAPGRAPFDPQQDETLVRLGPPALHLAGRVVDERDQPMEGVEVRALGLNRVGGVALEDLSTSDGPGPFTHDETDEQGRFEIAGLERRAYVLGLLDRRSLRYAQSDPIQAGRTDAEIRFRSGDAAVRIAGRVVGRAGEPVPGAEVRVVRDFAWEEGSHAERVDLSSIADSEGRFELPAVAPDVRAIGVARAGDVAYEHSVERGQDLEHLVLVAYGRAHMQIDLTGSDTKPDGFEVLDALGRILPITKQEGNTSMSTLRWPIIGDHSDAVAVLDAAETVVLYRGSEAIGRIPASLVAGELTILRP